jgi:PAS domain S-box-containing protein
MDAHPPGYHGAMSADETSFDGPADAEPEGIGLRAAPSGEEMDALFQLTRELLVISDFEGRFLHVSPAWTATLGWTSAELCAGSSLDFIHPEDRALTRTVVQRLRESGRLIAFQNRFRRRDGAFRALSWRASVSLDRSRYHAVALDVSDQLAAQEGASILAAVLELATDAVIAHDSAGRITAWNPGAERLLGWSSVEAVGRPVAALTAAGRGRLPDFHDQLEKSFSSERTTTIFVHKDGREVEVAVAVAPVGDGHGRITGAVMMARSAG